MRRAVAVLCGCCVEHLGNLVLLQFRPACQCQHRCSTCTCCGAWRGHRECSQNRQTGVCSSSRCRVTQEVRPFCMLLLCAELKPDCVSLHPIPARLVVGSFVGSLVASLGRSNAVMVAAGWSQHRSIRKLCCFMLSSWHDAFRSPTVNDSVMLGGDVSSVQRSAGRLLNVGGQKASFGNTSTCSAQKYGCWATTSGGGSYEAHEVILDSALTGDAPTACTHVVRFCYS
jgi:hypothetical protein